eukprot:GGOE01002513.1.p1 GENE.GGOE01002513.1~~GGOE01002513.1.p1  ORF type:complete len:479 (-),score=93.55 GGOE01002513.1:137-1573(-)
MSDNLAVRHKALLHSVEASKSDIPFALRSWARVDWFSGQFHTYLPPPPHWGWYLDTASSLLQDYQTKNQSKHMKLEELKGILKEMRLRHRQGHSRSQADQVSNADYYRYNDEASRMAFFFFSVPKHAVTFVDTLKAVHNHCAPAVAAAKQAKRQLVVSSFGGGPLPDVLGLLVYLTDTNQIGQQDRVAIHVFDMEAWRPVMEAAATHAHKHFPNLEFHFHVCDVTVADAEQVVVQSTDIFIFSYFMTEMQSYASQFADFFRGMMQVSKPGAVFISLDPTRSPRNTKALIRDLVNSSSQNTRMLFNSHLRGYSELNVPRYKYVDWSLIIQMERIASKGNPLFKARRLPRGKGKRRKEIFAFIRPAMLSRGSISVWTRTADGAHADTLPAEPPAFPTSPPVMAAPTHRAAITQARRRKLRAVHHKKLRTGKHGDASAALSSIDFEPFLDASLSSGAAQKRKQPSQAAPSISPSPKRPKKG